MLNHRIAENNIITRDYNGQVFHFREDGYFNMTRAAKVFGKRLDNFFANDETIEYANELEKLVPGIPVIKVQKGNGVSPTVGTWGHPKLAVFFARWLDVRFAVFCDMVIDDILNKKAELTITKPEESAVMALPQTYLESMKELVKSLEAKEVLKQQNAVLLPKATSYDEVVSNDGLYTSTQAAPLVGCQSAIALNKILKNLGWKSKRDADAPTKKALKEGWIVVRMRQRSDTYRSFPQVFVTPKGIDKLRGILLASEKAAA